MWTDIKNWKITSIQLTIFPSLVSHQLVAAVKAKAYLCFLRFHLFRSDDTLKCTNKSWIHLHRIEIQMKKYLQSNKDDKCTESLSFGLDFSLFHFNFFFLLLFLSINCCANVRDSCSTCFSQFTTLLFLFQLTNQPTDRNEILFFIFNVLVSSIIESKKKYTFLMKHFIVARFSISLSISFGRSLFLQRDDSSEFSWFMESGRTHNDLNGRRPISIKMRSEGKKDKSSSFIKGCASMSTHYDNVYMCALSHIRISIKIEPSICTWEVNIWVFTFSSVKIFRAQASANCVRFRVGNFRTFAMSLDEF